MTRAPREGIGDRRGRIKQKEERKKGRKEKVRNPIETGFKK